MNLEKGIEILYRNSCFTHVLFPIYLDEDECETRNGGCSQKCRNTQGSYRCGCVEGYTPNSNATRCTPQGNYHTMYSSPAVA